MGRTDHFNTIPVFFTEWGTIVLYNPAYYLYSHQLGIAEHTIYLHFQNLGDYHLKPLGRNLLFQNES
jgi:hypothetical protein